MAAQPAVGDLVGHKYRLLRRIGSGGTGSVWEAANADAGAAAASVAIKLLHPLGDQKLRSRFEHEARTSARLHSPHIVRVEHYGVDDGTPFMVLELLTGEDLGARLKRVERLSFEQLCPIATQIAAGLQVAHEASVVHRDLKPPNIFIVERAGMPPQVKLLDFGIARSEDSALAGLTTIGKTLGSPYYMSPEQAAGRPVDARSDLWSFGVVLFRALTGRRPFEGPELASVMVAIAKERHPKPSSIVPALPAGTDAFFARALRKDAQDRFQTASEMIAAFLALAPSAQVAPVEPAALEAAAAGAQPPAPPRPPDGQAESPAWKPIVHRVLVAVVVLLCAGSYAYANREVIQRALQDGPEPAPPVAPAPPAPLPGRIPQVQLRGPSDQASLPLDRVFIMNVWLQRCEDCMPSFEAWRGLARRSALPDVPIVNVAYGGVDPAWAAQYEVEPRLVIDPGDRLVRPLQVSRFTTFVVAPDGTILFRGEPATSGFEQQLAAAVERGAAAP